MILWASLIAIILILCIAWFYVYGPGYELRLGADDPPINPQHPQETKLALSLVRAYAKANGKMTDYEKIITTPEGGFEIQIGDQQVFAFTEKKLYIRTVVDAQLGSDMDVSAFNDSPALFGGKLIFSHVDDIEVLYLVHSCTNLEMKKVDFVTLTENYVIAAKNSDAVLMESLRKAV